MLLYSRKLLVAYVSVNEIDLCCAYKGLFALRDYLDTLCRAVSSLVKLTGEKLNGKGVACTVLKLVAYVIKLRLGENAGNALLKKRPVNVFNVVAVEKTDLFKRAYSEK